MVFEKLETTFKKVLNILESAPGRPQRTASTKVPEASEPTESGTAEPKVEDKTEDKDVPDASARRAEKPTLAAPATPAAKVDFVDSSEEVESVEWSRFKVWSEKKNRVRFKLKVLVTGWVAYSERVLEMRYIRWKTCDFKQLAVVNEALKIL